MCALLLLVSYFGIIKASENARICYNSLPPSVLRHILYLEPNLHLQQLGNVSDIPGSLKRTFLDAGHRRAAALLQRWMASAGMATWVDAVGNVRGRALSSQPASPATLIGSHYDTVIDGGKYDGALGIISGIAAVKALVLEAAVNAGTLTPKQLEDAVTSLAEAAADTVTASGGGILDVDRLLLQHLKDGARPLIRRPVEVVAFSDEEGVRFQSTFLGSKALTGSLVDSGILDVRDAQGQTILDALRGKGLADSVADIQAAALPVGALAGYVEVHLEQGPVLEELGSSVGVVTGISGQSWLFVSLKGRQGHAGTVPMRFRKDPYAGAAYAATQIETLCRSVSLEEYCSNDTFEETESSQGVGSAVPGCDPSLVCTVGFVHLWPGASNVIPAEANFTVDIRSRSDPSREAVVAEIKHRIQTICSKRSLECLIELRHSAKAVHSDPGITNALAVAVEESTSWFDANFEGCCGVTEESSCATGFDLRTNVSSGSGAVYGPGGSHVHDGSEINNNNSARDLHEGCEIHGVKGNNSSNSRSANAGIQRSPLSAPSVTRLVSGAGHDAMAMADVAPIGMLFVRCAGGISHSPEEWVSPDDVASGTAVLLQYLRAWEQEDW